MRRVAGLFSQLRSENELVRREMRFRRKIYARRIAAAMPNPLPALRTGVLSTSELATVWQLPRGRVKHGGLLRSTVRRASAPAGIDRDGVEAVAITSDHLEQLTDRGDGVLVLIRPHDDVPKTILLDQLIPQLTALLIEYNTKVTHPALQMRLRAVVHAGEVHGDSRGFYGEAIDVAIRLLDSAPVKRALKQTASPLVLVVSEGIYAGIVSHGYVDSDTYRPLVRVRVANKQRRGWVYVPDPGDPSHAADIASGNQWS